MGRPKSDPSRLIARLRAALKVAKKDSKADASLMAEIVGMTWRNLRDTYIEPDSAFPIVARGAEGQAWEFHVRSVLTHMLKRAEERVAANRRLADERAGLLNFTVPEEEEALGFAEISRLADLTYRMLDEQKSMGLYVSAERHRMIVGGLLMKVRDSLQGAVGRIDPAGKLPPAVREAIKHELTTIMLGCNRDARAFLEEQSAPIQPSRNRRRASEARAR